MKLFPSVKEFSIAFVIALVLNFMKILQIGSTAELVGFIINLIIYAFIVLIVIRIIMWLGKKMGMGK